MRDSNMPADAELRIGLVAGHAANRERLVGDLQDQLRSRDLQVVHLESETDAREFFAPLRIALECFVLAREALNECPERLEHPRQLGDSKCTGGDRSWRPP